MKTMKISIIMPVFNKDKYIRSILKQVKDQSFKDFECIIIDDGSTDMSGLICDEFANIDDRFKVFHIPNGGVSRARNLGLEKALGEYITFIDSDDEILTEYLENLVCCIEKSGADMVISGHQKFWDNKLDRVENCPPILNGMVKLKDILDSFAFVQKSTGIFGWCWAKIFPKTLATGIRFDETLRLAEDFDFYLKLYNKISLIHFDDKCLYRYRQEADNSSMIVADEKIDYYSQLKLNIRYKEFLISNGSYEKENRLILEQILSNYLYFCIYYCPEDIINDRVIELAEVRQREEISCDFGKKLQRCTLKRMKKGNYRLAVRGVLFYKKSRKALKRIVQTLFPVDSVS